MAGSLTAQRGTVKEGYNFWFYNPDSVKSEVKKPLVIFLHGASLCGRDLNRVRRYGTIDALEKGRELDAFVVAPQNPGGSWKPAKINNILEWACENYNVDRDRIYVLGMSLGGYGTLDMAAAYPDKIAAAMAFCGGSTSKDYEAMSRVPLWIVHGTADAAVPVSASDKVVAGIRGTGDDSRLIYDRIPGMNHSRPARYFYLKESYDWLFAHSLKDPERNINKELTFTHANLSNAYKDLRKSRRVRPASKASASTMAEQSPVHAKKNISRRTRSGVARSSASVSGRKNSYSSHKHSSYGRKHSSTRRHSRKNG